MPAGRPVIDGRQLNLNIKVTASSTGNADCKIFVVPRYIGVEEPVELSVWNNFQVWLARRRGDIVNG